MQLFIANIYVLVNHIIFLSITFITMATYIWLFYCLCSLMPSYITYSSSALFNNGNIDVTCHQCIIWWCTISNFTAKPFLQRLHFNGFSRVWVYWWLFNNGCIALDALFIFLARYSVINTLVTNAISIYKRSF